MRTSIYDGLKLKFEGHRFFSKLETLHTSLCFQAMKFFLMKGVEDLFVFGGESDAICTPNLTYFVPMPEMNIEIIGLDFIRLAWLLSSCLAGVVLCVVKLLGH